MRPLPKQNARLGATFVVLFFITGATALAYQLIWAKAIGAAVGQDFPAVLATVTAFMGGMTLGNFVLARWQRLNPRAYGWLEIIIGAWGIGSMILIPTGGAFMDPILGISPGAVTQWSVVFLWTLAVLLPATAAMGATLPAVERTLRIATAGNATGLLYGANTAGAMAGAFMAAFVLMPRVGIRASIFLCAILNLACGVAALWLTRRQPLPETVRRSERLSRLTIAQLFVSGLLGIGFEVVMIRALGHTLENTIYTFACVVAIFLLGTAIGAIIFHKTNSPRIKNTAWLFGGLPVVSLLTVIAMRWSGPAYRILRDQLGDSLPGVAAAEAIVTACYFLLPAMLMGATWTGLVQGSLASRDSLAWAAGINSLGAMLAPVLFGLAALPLLGLKWTFLLFPTGYALLAWKRWSTRSPS